MSRKQFLPFLTDDQGRSLTVDGGTVVTRAIPDPLDNSPEGWEKNVIQFARNGEFRGLIKSYTSTLKFFLDGATVLRDAFYRKGIEVVLLFIWLKLNTEFGAGMKHEGWYKGEVDFSTFKDHYDSVECNITEGGFYKYLQANKSIVYTIPLASDPKTVSVELDGINLTETLNYEIYAQEYIPDSTHHYDYVGITFLNKEGLSAGITEYTVINEGTGTPDFTTDQHFFLHTDYGVTAHFKFPFSFSLGAFRPGGFSLTSEFGLKLNTQTREYILVPDATYAGTHSYNFDFTWTLLPGENVFLIAHSTTDSWKWEISLGEMTVDYTTRMPTTVIQAQRVFDLGNNLVQQMSKNANTNVSMSELEGDFLKNDYNLLCTSGDGIRGLSTAIMKTKFSDWHKSVDAVKCIGLEIVDNNPVVGSRYDLYSDTVISSMGEASKLVVEPAKEYQYDSIEIGYPHKDSDAVNGVYSFNNTSVWKTPLLRNKNLYDAKSVYLADPYVIELYRRNLEGKTTTDALNNIDNDIFFLDCEKKYADLTALVTITGPNEILFPVIGLGLLPGVRFSILNGMNIGTFTILTVNEIGPDTSVTTVEGLQDEANTITFTFLHYRLRRDYQALSGVPANSFLFNTRLSPKSIAKEHYRWWRSGLDHQASNFVVFQSTDKNADLVITDVNGNVIVEKDNIAISTMGLPCFQPYYLSFEIESPTNLLTLMKNNSHGHFNFTMNGVNFEGFPEDIKTNDSNLETQTYKLLSSPNVDLTKLIHR